jgi:periplasmic protein TonB
MTKPQTDDPAPRGYAPRRRPRWWLVGLIVVGHLLLGALLIRLLAPEFTQRMVEQAGRGFTVIVTTPPPTPTPEPEPDAGAAGDPGREATAREVAAPPNPLPSPSPLPRAASTGTQDRSGAREEGDGTGAAGPGDGTGSGAGGQGRGGGIASGPTVLSGRIDAARDFPIPEGGRQVRDGTSVTVVFTVGVDGRARDCSVSRAGPDPATNALVCPLVMERIRFNPARDADGNPVPARYGWRQDFFRRQ